MRIEVRCPAKINTFLSVGPPDATGYHPIRTDFQAISLADTLIIQAAEQSSFHCFDEVLPEQNTVVKALNLLRECVQAPPISVSLRKRIPMQSGLGGGSSDAAGLLRGVCGLLTLEPPAEDIRAIAAAIGKDVPFFFVGGRARAEGFGEKLTALNDMPTRFVVLVRPSEGISTGEAYEALDAVKREWKEFPPYDQTLREAYNDFLRVAPCACAEWIDRLLHFGATSAGLSGSGSAVFGLFDEESTAASAQKAIESEGAPWCVLCRTLSREESLWMS